MAEPPMEPREALARAMRDEIWGANPPWEMATEYGRDVWLFRAEAILLHLGKSGFAIARADARKDREG